MPPACCAGQVVATRKRQVAQYQVFDGRRCFTPGQDVCVFGQARLVRVSGGLV